MEDLDKGVIPSDLLDEEQAIDDMAPDSNDGNESTPEAVSEEAQVALAATQKIYVSGRKRRTGYGFVRNPGSYKL